MHVKMFALTFALCASLFLSAASAQEKPPAPGGESSPSDSRPVPGKAVQGPQQAPEKQAPAPAQAPAKSASVEAGPLYTVAYAPQCANCQVRAAAPVAQASAPATTYQRTANTRRGIFRRGYR